MNEKEALNVLIQAVMIGQQNGVYSLRDSSIIFQAITVLDPDFEKENAAAQQAMPQQAMPQQPQPQHQPQPQPQVQQPNAE